MANLALIEILQFHFVLFQSVPRLVALLVHHCKISSFEISAAVELVAARKIFTL